MFSEISSDLIQLISDIQTKLRNYYFATVCNVLNQRDDMRLRNIAADICKDLGKPVPKGMNYAALVMQIIIFVGQEKN